MLLKIEKYTGGQITEGLLYRYNHGFLKSLWICTNYVLKYVYEMSKDGAMPATMESD